MTLKLTLARLIRDLDERYPGEPDAPFEIPAEVWYTLVDLAVQVEAETTGDDQ